MKTSISFILILNPLLSFFLLNIFEVNFFWEYSENYKIFNLIYSSICFALCMIGLTIKFNRLKHYLLPLSIFIFFCYQLFSWDFKTKNFIDKIEIKNNQTLVLSAQRGGAIGNDILNVISYKSKNIIFIKSKTLHSFEDASMGSFLNYSSESDTVTISYEQQAIPPRRKQYELNLTSEK